MQLEYPCVIMNIDEIVNIYDAEERTGNKFEEEINSIDKDIFLDDATERGISRREKILGITPQDDDTIEERRFKVKTKWNDTYPYTNTDLIQRLDLLLGEGTYTIAIDQEKMEMSCILELKAQKMYDAFVELLEEIVPLNVVIKYGIRYTQQKDLVTFKHRDLTTFKHEEIRNRKVLGE